MKCISCGEAAAVHQIKEELTTEPYYYDNRVFCIKCQGTGLNNYKRNTCEWDSTFCYYCKGTGEINWQAINGIHICNQCNGTGCTECENKGYLDWIENIRKVTKKHSTFVCKMCNKRNCEQCEKGDKYVKIFR